MSRAFKDALCDEITNAGGTGFDDPTRVEKLSGADLAQVLLTVNNGDTANVDANGVVTLGVNAAFPGNPNSTALSGADLERFAGSQ